MNILVRMDNAQGRKRLDASLPNIAMNLYYPRNSARMVEILKLTRMHAIILGVFLDDATVFETLRLLQQAEFAGPAPTILCCCTRSPTLDSSNKSLELACTSLGAKHFVDARSFYGESFTITIQRIFTECLEFQSMKGGI